MHYLSDFCCPLGGRAAGKPFVLRHEAEVFLSTGREFVYVYDQEGGLLTVSGGREGGRAAPFRGEPGPRVPSPDLALLAPRRCTSFPTRYGTCSSWPSAGHSTSCVPGLASTACRWTRWTGEGAWPHAAGQ